MWIAIIFVTDCFYLCGGEPFLTFCSTLEYNASRRGKVWSIGLYPRLFQLTITVMFCRWINETEVVLNARKTLPNSDFSSESIKVDWSDMKRDDAVRKLRVCLHSTLWFQRVGVGVRYVFFGNNICTVCTFKEFVSALGQDGLGAQSIHYYYYQLTEN